ncbi:MAG: GlsB/YeaQ/YmgE family stress response membrane protein [Acidobacteria bacterium]|nr:GlsB/YeaQ/YmgE family stress response membrane protein [Acidobacteriota bacterium]MCL5288450.1 GlsB/YeaQ/YmgE family stress response membrane protein [Acidobacteriota bacterium]
MRNSLIGWIFIGLIAGWLAGKISRGRGFGCLADVILGLIGALLGGWIFTKLGIWGGGFLYSLAAATVGAVVLVSVARMFGGKGD